MIKELKDNLLQVNLLNQSIIELLIEKEEVVEKLWYQIETFLSANN